MTELAPLDNYQGSDPELVVFNISPVSFGTQTTVFTTDGNSVWRLRVLTVAGNSTGTAGNIRLGLNINIFGGVGLPWTNSNNDAAILATVPQNIPVGGGDSFCYTWSTETASTYFSQDAAQGWVAQAGIPLVFLPAQTLISLVRTRIGAGDGNFTILDGFLQIEKFPLSALSVGTQGSQENVYLLPTAI